MSSQNIFCHLDSKRTYSLQNKVFKNKISKNKTKFCKNKIHKTKKKIEKLKLKSKKNKDFEEQISKN